MSAFIQILPEVAILVAVIGAILFLVLAFRNPLRPQWLHWNAMPIAASLLVAAAVSGGIGIMIAGSVAAGFNAGNAILLTLAVAGGAGYAMVRGLHIGERLRRSDAGQSPFYLPAGANALTRVWRRQFGGGAGA
jgi:hypothetical protein